MILLITCGSLYTVEAAFKSRQGLLQVCGSRAVLCVLLLTRQPCCCSLSEKLTFPKHFMLLCSMAAAKLSVQTPAAVAEQQQDTCLTWQA
jgi:hypothetical protein